MSKDTHKREMTFEEKQRLSASLQSLPAEKLENIVQIIKKRNPSLFQQEDEIEVDIDSFDTETLWELDRFVNNCKKSMSKNKEKENGVEQVHPTGMEDLLARERVSSFLYYVLLFIYFVQLDPFTHFILKFAG